MAATALPHSISTDSRRSVSFSSTTSSVYSPSPNVRRLKWGIFDIAYEIPATPPLLARIRGWLSWVLQREAQAERGEDTDWKVAFRATFELLKLVFSFAPAASFQYVLCVVWIAISPAISLFLAFCTLTLIEAAIFDGEVPLSRAIREEASLYLMLWLGCAFVSSYASREMEERKLILEGHLRSHFFPLLVDGSLNAEVCASENVESGASRPFPNAWAFGEEVPAWNVINDLTIRLRDSLALVSELLSIAIVIRSLPSTDGVIFGALTIIVVAVVFFAPSNGVGGVGYTFWTQNEHYYRLLGLYTTIFDERYRSAIVKDDSGGYLSEGEGSLVDVSPRFVDECAEYRRVSEALGPVKANLLSLACSLPPPWYWAQTQIIITEYPMALYVFFGMGSLSSSSIVTVAIFQYGINALTHTVDAFRAGQGSGSMLATMKNAQEFMRLIEGCNTDDRTKECETKGEKTNSRSKRGVKSFQVTLRDVSLRYDDDGPPALKNVSLTIKRGEFVLVVGENGSGKTSLLNVLTGTVPPDNGEVFINRKGISTYDRVAIRRATAYVTQNEPIYPLSLYDNIKIGTGRVEIDKPLPDTPDPVQRAASIAGCEKLLRHKGSLPGALHVVSQSVRGCGNGDVGTGAYRELRRHDPSGKTIKLSPGERQRVTLARCIAKIQNGKTKVSFVVLDEATSALDHQAENGILNFFFRNCESYGCTTVLVTHRLGAFAPKAHRIIFMRDGEVLQNGKHDDLLQVAGGYRDWFTAQTASLSGHPDASAASQTA